jgi:hypothetical protein
MCAGSVPPKDSGIKGTADALPLNFHDELIEKQGSAHELRYSETERDFHHFYFNNYNLK